MQYSRLYQRDPKRTIDWTIIACYLLLIFIGWLNIYASVHATEAESLFDFSARSGKQFLWMLSGISLGSLILFAFNPRLWEVISIPVYLIIVLLLIAVIFVSSNIKGSHSWFSLGPVSFQPAEISKIATSLVLATILSSPGFRMEKIRDFLLAAAVIVLPMIIIVAEKETGTALVYIGFVFTLYREGLSGWYLFFIGMCVLLFILTLTVSTYVSVLVMIAILSLCYVLNNGQLKKWILVAIPTIILFAFMPKILSLGGDNSFLSRIKPLWILIGSSILTIPFILYKSYKKRNPTGWLAVIAFIVGLAMVFSTEFLFHKVLKEHQRSRIEVLLGMKEDLAGAGYNVNQSMIAIGSGGFFGKGYLHGTQTTFGFVPEQSTDFIFCTIGEEWGFLGCLGVIIVYVILIWQLIKDAERSRESFTRIYGYCVASIIFMHLFINVGMTIGLMPVIGIPLPLLSYGGSSLWSFTLMIFIFLALYRQEKKYF